MVRIVEETLYGGGMWGVNIGVRGEAGGDGAVPARDSKGVLSLLHVCSCDSPLNYSL